MPAGITGMTERVNVKSKFAMLISHFLVTFLSSCKNLASSTFCVVRVAAVFNSSLVWV